MKKITFLLFGLLFIQQTFSQTRIVFNYDNAGNQVVRKLCLNCNEFRQSNQEIKEVTDVKEEDLLNFFEEDVISYYPNPVKEELFLKWELINSNTVSKIDIYNLNGQIIKSFTNLTQENSKNISFQEYPSSTYLVLLLYSNGEQQSITIVKE